MNTLPVCIYHGRFIASTVMDCPECERNKIMNEQGCYTAKPIELCPHCGMPNQRWFIAKDFSNGYECQNCENVYLMPNAITDTNIPDLVA